MSGVSFQELFLLIAIGLVVLGPKRLPQVANQIGSWVGQARRMTRMMKRQLEDEINLDLDDFNVQKQLGLDQDPLRNRTQDSNKPWFAENGERRNNEALKQASEDEAQAVADAASPAPEKEELPDDYSPAHAADDVGTGVGDDDDYIDDDELEPMKVADSGDVAKDPDRRDPEKETA